jgi:predicted phage-related endonuclease
MATDAAHALRREAWQISSRGEWLERRRAAVNSSQMGALLGVHPYLSPEQLVGQMRGESVRGDTPSMRRGRVLEPAVAAALQEDHPEWPPLVKSDSYYWLPEHRIGATPDYLWGEDGLIECKTCAPHVWEQWRGRVPLAYLLQLLTALMCTGRERGIVAVMVCAGQFPVHEVEVARHPEAERKIIEAVGAFWDAYDAGLPTPPQSAAEIEAMLDTGEHLDWSGNDDIREMLEERRTLKTEMSALATRLGEIDYTIKNTIGPASTAYLPGWSISFRRYHRAEYTVPERDIRTLRIKENAVE